jgi:hypothetical protein
VLIIRDFLAAPAGEVLLDLRADDGLSEDDGGEDPRTCSSARLFERFAREFKPLSDRPGFAYQRLGPVASPLSPLVLRYRVSRRAAVEFLLRKDYRADWESEVKEEYTYFTQEEFEALFARLGLRVVASTPLRNPWIVRHRFERQFEWRATDGAALDFPATNYVIAGERVPAGEGVRFGEGEPAPGAPFLTMDHYRDVETGRVLDLVRRPHRTLDVLPWFDAGPDLFVLARKSYPRPILQCARRGSPLLGDRRPPGYVTEPLIVLQEDQPIGLTVEAALARHAHVEPADIRAFAPGATYYPSPGGILEEVRSVLVEIAPRFVEKRLPAASGFSTSGMVRAIEARQLLRAAQVGGLPDARLEMNVYQLLAARGLDAGPWIGEELAPRTVDVAATSTAALRARPARRRFVRAAASESRGFLRIERAWFDEHDAAGTVVARQPLELVVPAPLSLTSVATAPLVRAGGEVLLGLDDFDLPAAQCFEGNSNILVAPAWRLPRALDSLLATQAWLRARLAEEYGIECGTLWELGGPYHPTPGATPEVVHPFALEVTAERASGARRLTWVPLGALVADSALLVDGHLRVVALRAAHALGLLSAGSGA